MTPEFLTGFFFEAIKIAITLAAPSVTSINEMTMTFIPKMLAVACALLFFLPWMVQTMVTFTQNLFTNIVIYIR